MGAWNLFGQSGVFFGVDVVGDVCRKRRAKGSSKSIASGVCARCAGGILQSRDSVTEGLTPCHACRAQTAKRMERHSSGEYLPRCVMCGAWGARPQRTRRRDFTRADLYKSASRARRRNPVPASGAARRIAQARSLGLRFSGTPVERGIRVPVEPVPKEMLAIGYADGILYSTVRDGVLEKYIHRFRGKARPLLAVSHDGRRAYLLGGEYVFTERGFIDRPMKKGR